MSIGTDTIDAVQTALINASVGQKTNSAADWMIYKWTMQDSDPAALPTVADRALCIYDTPGMPMEEGFAMDYPGIQIVARGKPDDARAVREKLQAAMDALHAQEASISSNFVYFYCQQSAPLQMGIDERRRIKMSINFRSMRNRPA